MPRRCLATLALVGLGAGAAPARRPSAALDGTVAALPAKSQRKFHKLVDQAASAFEGGDAEAAERAYDAAIELAPKQVDAVRSLGLILYRSGRFAKAHAVLKRALELETDHKATRRMLCDSYAAAGDLESALYHYGRMSKQLRPLNGALAPAWRKAPTATIRLVPERSSAVPRAYYTDPAWIPLPALQRLCEFLSMEVVGASYSFEFTSSSMQLAGRSAVDGSDLLQQAVLQLRTLLPLSAREAARCAEWWVHRRPPRGILSNVTKIGLEGHPLHWDDDGPEAGGQRPLYTSVLYLTDGAPSAPAPTLVLNTTHDGAGFHIEGTAWVIHAALGRVAVFEGVLLHGVLPSAGEVDVKELGENGTARLSLNVAWWPHDCRKQSTHRSLGAPPPADRAWAAAMSQRSGPLELMSPKPTKNIFCGPKQCKRFRDEL